MRLFVTPEDPEDPNARAACEALYGYLQARGYPRNLEMHWEIPEDDRRSVLDFIAQCNASYDVQLRDLWGPLVRATRVTVLTPKSLTPVQYESLRKALDAWAEAHGAKTFVVLTDRLVQPSGYGLDADLNPIPD